MEEKISNHNMSGLLNRTWWVLCLRGILAIVMGLFAFLRPGLTLAILVLWFGIYAFIDGMFSLIASFRGWNYRHEHWLLLLEGIIGIWVGIITFRSPQITTVALLFFIAAWSLAIGVLRIVEAIRLRQEIKGEFWLVLSGIASVAFAFMLLIFPSAGVLGLLWLIGAYALVFGSLLMVLGLKMKFQHLDHPSTPVWTS